MGFNVYVCIQCIHTLRLHPQLKEGGSYRITIRTRKKNWKTSNFQLEGCMNVEELILTEDGMIPEYVSAQINWPRHSPGIYLFFPIATRWYHDEAKPMPQSYKKIRWLIVTITDRLETHLGKCFCILNLKNMTPNLDWFGVGDSLKVRKVTLNITKPLVFHLLHWRQRFFVTTTTLRFHVKAKDVGHAGHVGRRDQWILRLAALPSGHQTRQTETKPSFQNGF